MGAPSSSSAENRSPTPQKPGSIRSLTGLRFFAALWVVAFHTLAFNNGYLQDIRGAGFLGVPVFFVLSGFVLTYSYVESIDRLKVSTFLQARWARIYPALVVAVVYTFVLERTETRMSPIASVGNAGANLLLLSAWFPVVGLDSPLWSVSDEAFFYGLFKHVAIKIRTVVVNKDRETALLLLALSILVPLLPLLLLGTHYASAFGHVATTLPILRLPTFCMGIYLALQYTNPRSVCSHLLSKASIVVAALVMGVVIFLLVPQTAKDPLFHFMAPVSSGVIVLPVCVLLLALTRREFWLSKLLSSPVLVLLGEASYSLYLFHAPTWSAFKTAAQHFHFDAQVWWFAYFAVLQSLCILCFKYLETPLRILLRPKALGQLPPALAAERVRE
jgi:peptidoglycan/LPS O-acetylase OafA/YrhL